MGYFSDALESLHDHSKIYMTKEELLVFQRLFEDPCRLPTLPLQFLRLVEFAKYLVKEIIYLKDEVRKKHVAKSNVMKSTIAHHEQYITKEENTTYGNKRSTTRRELNRKIDSSLEATALVTAASVFKYLPIKDLITAEKYGNCFLLNAAGKCLDGDNKTNITLDLKETTMIISKKMKERINHLLFTGLDSYSDVDQTLKNIEEMVQSFKNAEKVTFEGKALECLFKKDANKITIVGNALVISNSYPLLDLLVRSVVEMTARCPLISHVQLNFMYDLERNIDQNFFEKIARDKLLSKWNGINKLTVKITTPTQGLEYMLEK